MQREKPFEKREKITKTTKKPVSSLCTRCNTRRTTTITQTTTTSSSSNTRNFFEKKKKKKKNSLGVAPTQTDSTERRQDERAYAFALQFQAECHRPNEQRTKKQPKKKKKKKKKKFSAPNAPRTTASPPHTP
jgi:hypothetical protein